MAEAGHAGDNGFDGGVAEGVVPVNAGERTQAEYGHTGPRKQLEAIMHNIAAEFEGSQIHNSYCSTARRSGRRGNSQTIVF